MSNSDNKKIKESAYVSSDNRGENKIPVVEKSEVSSVQRPKVKVAWWQVIVEAILTTLWAGLAIIGAQFIVGIVITWLFGTESLNKATTMGIYSALSYILAILLVMVPLEISVGRRVTIANKEKSGQKATKMVDRQVLNTRRVNLGLKGLPTWSDLGLAPIAYVVSAIFGAILIAFFQQFAWFNAEEVQNIGFNLYGTGIDKIIAFVTLVVVAPIAEEIIFRGWLYGRLREIFSEKATNGLSIVISSLLTSLLFGIVHLQWNVGVTVFAMSIILCGLREITGTIYSGILVHMLRNGIALYLLFLGIV